MQIAVDRRSRHHSADLLRRAADAQLTSLYGAASAAASAASAAAAAPSKVVKVIPRQFDAGKLMVPEGHPQRNQEDQRGRSSASAGMGVVGGVPGGVAGGAVGGVLGGILAVSRRAAPPPPPPPKKEPPKPAASRIIGRRQRAGGQADSQSEAGLSASSRKQARISGTVELPPSSAKMAQIQNLTVVSGHPLLVQAALDAVKQWVYQPTLSTESR